MANHSNQQISRHLLWAEVRCKGSHASGEACCDGGVLRAEAALLFERIRERCGKRLGKDCPLRINSGVRCAIHNQRVGGAADSAHLGGMALDLRCPEGISLVEFWSICEEEAGLGGFGAYPWGAHVDVETNPPRRRWEGLTGESAS